MGHPCGLGVDSCCPWRGLGVFRRDHGPAWPSLPPGYRWPDLSDLLKQRPGLGVAFFSICHFEFPVCYFAGHVLIRALCLFLFCPERKGREFAGWGCVARSFDKGESPTISAGGREFAVTPELVELRKEQQKVSGRCAPARPSNFDHSSRCRRACKSLCTIP